jgi:Protein of unknown function (DUF3263)
VEALEPGCRGEVATGALRLGFGGPGDLGLEMLASPTSWGQSGLAMPLSERDREILDLEGSWWTHMGSKSTQIRELGMSPSQYYTVLRRLAGSADALEHAPLVVRRLQRQQAERRRDRFEGRAAQPHPPRR